MGFGQKVQRCALSRHTRDGSGTSPEPGPRQVGPKKLDGLGTTRPLLHRILLSHRRHSLGLVLTKEPILRLLPPNVR